MNRLLERDLLPDTVIRWGIRRLLRKRLREEARRAADPDSAVNFMSLLKGSPIAIRTDDANRQHYEIPTAFYERVLGPRLKYSSALWESETRELGAAEDAMLDLTCRRADLRDGQAILELGCGWGSLSLFMAERFPRCDITAVSNSRTQRAHIEGQARARGIRNLRVLTADVNELELDATFDRVVSVEMFEHMRNYDELMRRIRGWLRDDGRLFVHIFCHQRFAYTFETDGDDDWMARYFFSGGVMPSFDLLGRFDRDLQQEQAWRVSGLHYARTLEAWLRRMDGCKDELYPLFEQTYGSADARKWWVYWRVFFMACSELFACGGGEEWIVGHYLFRPRAVTVPRAG